MKKPRNAFFTFLMLLAMTSWGGSWTSGYELANLARPEVLIFWRFLVTVISFLPVLFIFGKSLKLTWPALLVSYNKMFFTGLETGWPGAGGVLVTTLNPILTFAFASLFFRQKIGGRAAVGLLLGTLGGLILLEIWATNAEKLLASGNAYFLAAACSWALLSLISEKSHVHLSPIIFSFYVYALATVMDFFLALPYEPLAALHQQGAIFWWNIVYLAVLATTFATTVYFVASTRLGANRASSFIFLVPPSAVLISWMVTGEKPKIETVIGGLIAMAAVYLINSGRRERQTATAQGEA